MSYCQDQAHESSPRWSDTFPEDALVGDIRDSLSAPLRCYLEYNYHSTVSEEILIWESLLTEFSVDSMPKISTMQNQFSCFSNNSIFQFQIGSLDLLSIRWNSEKHLSLNVTSHCAHMIACRFHYDRGNIKLGKMNFIQLGERGAAWSNICRCMIIVWYCRSLVNNQLCMDLFIFLLK